jgi:hypothetical protein
MLPSVNHSPTRFSEGSSDLLQVERDLVPSAKNASTTTPTRSPPTASTALKSGAAPRPRTHPPEQTRTPGDREAHRRRASRRYGPIGVEEPGAAAMAYEDGSGLMIV